MPYAGSSIVPAPRAHSLRGCPWSPAALSLAACYSRRDREMSLQCASPPDESYTCFICICRELQILQWRICERVLPSFGYANQEKYRGVIEGAYGNLQ